MKKDTGCNYLISFCFIGTPGRIRTCGLRIRRAGILKSKNVVITTSWFYCSFSTNFWFRLDMFGNIWPWRAQFGHNSIEYYPLPYSSLQHNLIKRCLRINSKRQFNISLRKLHCSSLSNFRIWLAYLQIFQIFDARNVNKMNREKSIGLSCAIHNSFRKWHVNAAIIVFGVVISV